MHESQIALQSLVSLSLAFGICYLFERSYREMKVDDEYFACFDQLLEWRIANPTMGIGDSAYARSLVMRRINAYESFALSYGLPLAVRIAQIGWLYSLLDDHGGPPPHQRLLPGFEEEP